MSNYAAFCGVAMNMLSATSDINHSCDRLTGNSVLELCLNVLLLSQYVTGNQSCLGHSSTFMPVGLVGCRTQGRRTRGP